jgi:hypothetical protein
MKITVAIYEGDPDIETSTIEELDAIIHQAAAEAANAERPNIIFLRGENGNYVSLVVGTDETVLGFNYSHNEPPYFVSKGLSEVDEPLMTAYVNLEHATHFSRCWVIPFVDGLRGIHEFVATNEQPECIEWTET